MPSHYAAPLAKPPEPSRWMRVWPWWQRLLHWGLAASVITAWLTRHASDFSHEAAGYSVLACAALRISLGVYGPPITRFRSFVVNRHDTWRYLKQLLHAQPDRYLNHNPLGAWMVLALLTTCTLTALFGWLYTTDYFWGTEWVHTCHTLCAWLLMGLIPVHLLGVLYASLRHRENLLASMLHGRKRL